MTWFIDDNDKRCKVVFELLKKNDKNIQIFNEKMNFFNENNAIFVFSPAKKWNFEELKIFPFNATILCGDFPNEENFKKVMNEKNIRIINLLQDNGFTIKNANLTAEGVLANILQKSEKSIFENKILILGNGRVAKSISILFLKLSLDFSICSFNENSFAQNYAFTKNTFLGNELQNEIHKYDIIINTIPAKIIDKNIFNLIQDDTLFFEVASKSCLFDENCLKKFKYEKLPALPQKYSPTTAGNIMFETIENYFERNTIKSK